MKIKTVDTNTKNKGNIMTNNRTAKFGIFYKSHGRWVGPYGGYLVVGTNNAKSTARFVATELKTKVQIRRATFSR